MGGYRGAGNTRDYEWPRMACPACGRDVAYSIPAVRRGEVATGLVFLRRHNAQKGVRCGLRTAARPR